MPRMLLIEPEASGHHVPYVRWLIESAASCGVQVSLATSLEVRRHPAIETLFHSIPFSWCEMPSLGEPGRRSVAALLAREFAYRRLFAEALQRARAAGDVDLVLLPYLDYCFHAFALAGAPFGGIPWAAISMRLFGSRWLNTRQVLMRLLLRDPALRVLFSLTLPEAYLRSIPAPGKIRYLPDPGDLRTPAERSSARAHLGVEGPALVILVYGTIDSRKGLVPLLQAIGQRDAPAVRVLVVGRQSAEMRASLAAPQFAILRQRGMLDIIDEFVDDALQGQVFAAADVVWLGYCGHAAMSGVLVLAGLAKRAVIVSDFGEMGRLARQHELGPVVNIEYPDSVLGAVRTLCNSDERARSAARCFQLFRNHEAHQVGMQLFAALGLSPRV
jgi:hypothetical protein